MKKAKFVLVRQDRLKSPLGEGYRGPYKVKAQGTSSYVLAGGSQSEDQVAINRLKLFHMREDAEEVNL